jgi:hypothetical protein
LVTGTGCELSTREPTLLIGAGALVRSAAEGLAAFAGCEASVKENTAATAKAHLITCITLPFPQTAPTLNAVGGSTSCPAGVVARTALLSSTDKPD